MEIPSLKLEALLKREAQDERGPGACLAVLHQGKVLFKSARGMAGIENPSPLTSTSVFNTGSVAKQFTAYAVCQLQQIRKLSLEDDVRKYIPELPNYGRPITLRHLLWHTSGLRCYQTLLWMAGVPGADGYSRSQSLELVCRQKELNFVPGSDCLYSNSNYLLLSEIIQRVSKKSMDETCKAAIFEPYGMKQTHFREDIGRPIPGLVSGHRMDRSGRLVVERSVGAVPGVGRLMSSLDDLVRWENFFLNPRKHEVPILRSMLSQGWMDNGQKVRYCGGLMLQNYRGLNMQRHDGFTGGMRTEFCRFPEMGVTFVALSNHARISPTWLARQAADLIFGRRLEPVSALGPGQPPAPPARAKVSQKRLKELAGLYMEGEEGAILELEARSTGLWARLNYSKIEFRPESHSGFQGQGPGAIYRLDVDGDGVILTKQGRARQFKKLKVLARVPEEKLERFAGRYACPEALTRLEIEVKDGRLWFVNQDGSRSPLRYLKGGHFYAYFTDWHFTTKGLVMHSPESWVRKLKWVRL